MARPPRCAALCLMWSSAAALRRCAPAAIDEESMAKATDEKKAR